MRKKIVTFGEIMLRLATPRFERFSQATHFEATFGGGEANVAVSLANFGMEVDYVTRLPDNEIGNSCLMDLRKHNVGTDKIVYGGDRLGIYFLETGAVARGSKVIYDRANSSIACIKPEMIDWDKVFEDVYWFHWTGITPAISEGAALVCREAAKAAAAKGITVSTDLNYRKNLWNWGKKAAEVMPGLVDYCDVILGNEGDAEKIFGIHPEGVDVTSGNVDPADYESVCHQLMQRFPKAKKVIITLRGSINANHNTWSGVLYNGEKLLNAPLYNISHIVDRVGGGDSFMEGLIYGMISFPGDDQRALDFAVVASEQVNKWATAEFPELIMGTGSVIDASTAMLYVQLDSNFIVSPLLDEQMAVALNKRKVLWSPGCGSVSEISKAESLGAEVVKIFPGAEVGGPKFIAAVKGPMPWTHIMPSGGVEPTESNLREWFKAGALCVGMGSKLLKSEMIKNKNFKRLEEFVRITVELISKLRQQYPVRV